MRQAHWAGRRCPGSRYYRLTEDRAGRPGSYARVRDCLKPTLRNGLSGPSARTAC